MGQNGIATGSGDFSLSSLLTDVAYLQKTHQDTVNKVIKREQKVYISAV
ncbi:hypothetical protein [Neobacillus terrae]|nr:hypothetical protein [Neobacillus terrae]NHM30369.1 hypothetical protein [Neobacillus terrae]